MQSNRLINNCRILFLFFLTLLLVLNSCRQKEKPGKETKGRIVYLQPFEGMPGAMVNDIATRLRTYYPAIRIHKSIPLPANAWYAPRKRFRADTLIRFLQERTPMDHFTIGLTDKDISTSKDKIADWGVMGLGYCPGRACVASSFRLPVKDKKEFLFKVAIHELGHTQGLPHCPQKSCYMRDAEAGNPLKEEIAFCFVCAAFLSLKGWNTK